MLLRVLRLTIISLSWLVAVQDATGSIDGTKHDFTGMVAEGVDPCVMCHTPHHAEEKHAKPLWYLTQPKTTFTLYATPELDPRVSSSRFLKQPVGLSKLCLSCHDGTIAIERFMDDFSGGVAGVGQMRHGHPVSVQYDEVVKKDPVMRPSTTPVTIGIGAKVKRGTIETLMLSNGQIQCSSCHDVHNQFSAENKFLKVSQHNSRLCLTCHDR